MSEISSCQVSSQGCIIAFEVLIPGLQGATAQPLILNGPALAGRASGTGGLESIGLGSNLSIVNGVLTLGIQGTVTSVGLSVPTGFDVSNSPVTGSGTLGISFSPGYSLPQTSKQAEWNTAYAERLRWNGGSDGLDAVAARSSLGLGSAALSPASAFANAAQGQLADTAVQPATLSSALASKVDTTDPRLSDAREWTASTIEQAEAESGTSTTRRAFTAQRVFQAIAAWWNGSSAKTKLDGIQAGAEVNVNADWNATSGDAQILNKPAIPSGADAVPQALGTAAAGVSSDYAREDHVHAMPTAGQVGAAASEHVHGNITNVGAIGSVSGVPIITGTDGVLQAGSFGTASGTFAQGNDARFHDAVTLSASIADILNLAGQELQADDPGGDRLLFWDDSASKLAHLQLGTNLSITGTTLNAAGGGGGGSFNGYAVGNWIAPVDGTIGAGSVGAGGSIIYLIPCMVKRSITVSDLGSRVATVAASNTVQLAIYASSNGLPAGLPLASTTDLSVAVATVVSAAVTPFNMTGGELYWMAVNATTGASVMVTPAGTSASTASLIGGPTLGSISNSVNQNTYALSVAATYGTWPDLTGVTTTVNAGTRGALVFLKISALL